MNLRALKTKALDVVAAFGAPPYSVYDKQSVRGYVHYYDLAKALAVADEDEARRLPSGGKVYPVYVNAQRFFFTVDKLGRRHLPRALRERML